MCVVAMWLKSDVAARYGNDARRVPAHMPHMIDTSIVAELQGVFPTDFERTSSHRFRAQNDMQVHTPTAHPAACRLH